MNLIRITKKELTKDIFRIFPMHRFLEVLSTKKLCLVRPKLWKDPMELLVFDHSFNAFGITDYADKYRDNYFAQCWTLRYESSALWSEYAPQHNGVRVRTSLTKMVKVLKAISATYSEESLFLGLVDYLSYGEIKKFLKNNYAFSDRVFVSNQLPFGQVQTFLKKLNQYSHETEIRIIFNSGGNNQAVHDNCFHIDIDPLELFDIIMLDPRMHDNIYEIYLEVFMKYGFEKNRIIRSDLYNIERLKKRLTIFK